MTAVTSPYEGYPKPKQPPNEKHDDALETAPVETEATAPAPLAAATAVPSASGAIKPKNANKPKQCESKASD